MSGDGKPPGRACVVDLTFGFAKAMRRWIMGRRFIVARIDPSQSVAFGAAIPLLCAGLCLPTDALSFHIPIGPPSPERVRLLRMPLFTYRSPNTGRLAQGFTAEDKSADTGIYEVVRCVLCRQVHHVNPATAQFWATTASKLN